MNNSFVQDQIENSGIKQQSALPTRSRREVTLVGIAVVMIIVVSVLAQSAAYITGGLLTLPDLVAAAPTAIALLFIFPTLLSRHPLKGWGTFIAAVGLTLTVYLLASAVDGFSGESLRTIAQIILAIGCALVGFSTGVESRSKQTLDRLIVWTCLLCSLGMLGMMLISPAADELKKNLIGGELMYLAVLGVAARLDQTGRTKTIWILGPVLLVEGIVTGHRVVAGLGAVALVADKILPYVKAKFLHRGAILAAGAVSVLSVLMYLYADSLPSFIDWNLYVQAKTGRQITSGRQLIWPPVVGQIMQRPWFGHGFSITAAQITGFEFSTHNAFLMVLLQVGWLGLIPVILILASLAWKGTGGKYTPWRTMLTITLVIVIINNTFETELIQNNYRIAAMIWLSLGFICARIPVKKSRAPSADSTTSLELINPHVINCEAIV